MIREFPLPDLGEGLTESEVVAWRVAVGDRVELNQIVADVETAKAVVELPSPFAGVITALHAEPGQTVDVGAPLFSCDTGEDAAPSSDASDASDASGAAGSDASGSLREPGEPGVVGGPVTPAETREPTLVGYGASAESGPRRRSRRAGVAAGPVPSGGAPRVPGPAGETTGLGTRTAERPRSTPPVRKLARDLGVDLERLAGTGERGLITRADVEAAATEVPEASGRLASETRIPIAGVRKHTAAAMVQSAFTAPHVTEFLTVDVTAAMDLLRSLRDDRAFAAHRITPLALVAKAVCIAARRTPEVNSHWDEDAREIVRYAHVNLGIAAATERGLVVPNITGADDMTLTELADAITALAETARAGRTSPADMTGGTISITNVGVFGVDAGTPILNPGEAAILAIGQVRRQPWEFRGEIALREVMTLSLSFDHRLVDGQQGSRFLVDVATILRDPGRALTMS
ncbi:2-oxo acid dehydrogenase subunit E2 [Agromyces intestinalis]|uniref:Dihydrolipoamide acetyltransferase component of pyruvate dehydrogenase complex n=1 Tax=Agromyces intestinalis TaxID=2592652 RepID=A0A5C1YIG7_9MICO|nr:dihydrolipoamide acetyltransferase family protein [Agromyces intestinalis]QEO16016.1 2-oxo acid dehydrogenase subunit E2 [Agromyces intestinalis]